MATAKAKMAKGKSAAVAKRAAPKATGGLSKAKANDTKRTVPSAPKPKVQAAAAKPKAAAKSKVVTPAAKPATAPTTRQKATPAPPKRAATASSPKRNAPAAAPTIVAAPTPALPPIDT